MTKIYLKVVGAEILFNNSFAYQMKDKNGKTTGKTRYIHTYGIKCTNGSRTSRFIVKTFGNESEETYCVIGDVIKLTGTLVEEKWKNDEGDWVSRVTIIADSIDIIDEDDEDEDVKPKRRKK
jgi:single-stranded DNA-binding protein